MAQIWSLEVLIRRICYEPMADHIEPGRSSSDPFKQHTKVPAPCTKKARKQAQARATWEAQRHGRVRRRRVLEPGFTFGEGVFRSAVAVAR